ncbi:MAG: hypothetical protein Q4Q17_00260 [Tissierellia bacterium]|nr:hypothetical protein [Tissierellia bacterium]
MKKIVYLLIVAFLLTGCVFHPKNADERQQAEEETKQDGEDSPSKKESDKKKEESKEDETVEQGDDKEAEEMGDDNSPTESMDVSPAALQASYEKNLKLIGTERDREAWRALESITQTGFCQDELFSYYDTHRDEMSTFGKITMARISYFEELFFSAREISSQDAFDEVLSPMWLDSSDKIYALEDVSYLEGALRDVFRSTDEPMDVLERQHHPKAIVKNVVQNREVLTRIYSGHFIDEKREDGIGILFDPEEQSHHTILLVRSKDASIVDEKELTLSGHTILKGEFLGNGREQILICSNAMDGEITDYTLLTFDGGKIKEKTWTQKEPLLTLELVEGFKMKAAAGEEEMEISVADREWMKELFYHDDGTPRKTSSFDQHSFYEFFKDGHMYLQVAIDRFVVCEDPEVSNMNFGPENLLRFNFFYKITEDGMEYLGNNIHPRTKFVRE